jgi:hypothetical protein
MAMILTVSCAAPYGPFTRNEWNKITQREFTGKPPGQVLDAASRVMELADPSHVHISNSSDGITAQRTFYVNSFILPGSVGCYLFDLRAERTESGTRTNLSISKADSCESTAVPGATTSVGARRHLVEAPDVYDLFYKRMASLLNGKPWVTCIEAGYYIFADNLSPLCLAAEDNPPTPDELGSARSDEMPSAIGSAPSKSRMPQSDSACLDKIKSGGSTSAKVKAAADLCSEGKISKEERNRLQAAILRGEI